MTGPAVPSGLEALLAQATPGQWSHGAMAARGGDNTGGERTRSWVETNVGTADDRRPTVAANMASEADARLIALAPDAVRLLIDMAARLTEIRASGGAPDFGDCRAETCTHPGCLYTRNYDALLARFAALDQRAGTA